MCLWLIQAGKESKTSAHNSKVIFCFGSDLEIYELQNGCTFSRVDPQRHRYVVFDNHLNC